MAQGTVTDYAGSWAALQEYHIAQSAYSTADLVALYEDLTGLTCGATEELWDLMLLAWATGLTGGGGAFTSLGTEGLFLLMAEDGTLLIL